MASSTSVPSVALPARVYSPLAGVLSYLIPGLGQLYQGRIAKGLLFLVCLNAMFYYGLALGDWQNVYLQPSGEVARGDWRPLRGLLDRVRYYGQFGIGVAAWPAIVQCVHLGQNPGEDRHPILGKYERMPHDDEANEFQRRSDKTPDLGWMYTVIAGVLNILVIYDAFAGPAFLPGGGRKSPRPARRESEEPAP
jgi:hypothetical protein